MNYVIDMYCLSYINQVTNFFCIRYLKEAQDAAEAERIRALQAESEVLVLREKTGVLLKVKFFDFQSIQFRVIFSSNEKIGSSTGKQKTQRDWQEAWTYR